MNNPLRSGFFYLLLVLASTNSSGQTAESLTPIIELKGMIRDQNSHERLSYASIGLFNKPVGTLTDSTGYFHIKFGTEYKNDSLQISMVGYNNKMIAVNQLLQEPSATTIYISQKPTLLKEIVFSNHKTQTTIIGREKAGKFLQLSVHNKNNPEETIGSEMGMRMKNNNKGAFLKDFNWYISQNNFTSIKFRINIYSIKNDWPDSLLYNRQIFYTTDSNKTGWCHVDLDALGIQVDGDFLISLQWVESKLENNLKPITMLPTTLSFSKNCYVRIASQDKWKRMGIHLSNYATIEY